MIAHRFKCATPSIPKPLAEKGHRNSKPPTGEDSSVCQLLVLGAFFNVSD